MARIRSLRPEFWDSQKVGRLTVLARLTFIGLISQADDAGRGRAEPKFLLGRLHAYAVDVDPQGFLAALGELDRAGVVVFYEVTGSAYYCLPGWKEHQKIEKPGKSLLPPLPEGSPTLPRLFPDSSPTPPRRIGVEGNGEEGKGRLPIPPRITDNGKTATTPGPNPLGFGAHADTPISQLHPGYCHWVLTKCEQRHELAPDQIAALEDRARASDQAPAPPPRKCKDPSGCNIRAEKGREYCPVHPLEG